MGRPRMGWWIGGCLAAAAVLAVATAAAPPPRGGPSAPPTAAAAPGGLSFPEPFDFHYPDEGSYPTIAAGLQVSTTLGESAATTFVQVPEAAGDITATANDLTGPDGAVLPKELVDLGVVTFADRTREPHYLANVSLRGGINPDVKQRAPVMPLTIVPDERDFRANTASATGKITLRDTATATAVGERGKGSQFWVTVRVPVGFAQAAGQITYRGEITVTVDGAAKAVPIEVTVLRTTLDELGAANRFVGVFETFDQVEPEFRDAVLADLRARGLNAVFQRGVTPELAGYFRANGFTTVINADDLDATAQDVEGYAAAGIPPLYYGYDEPNRNGTVDEQVAASRAVHAKGGLIGTSGSLAALRQIQPQAPQDWWNLTIATSWAATDPVFRHLDAVRADPGAKIAARESVYPMTLLELYPLGSRLLYGLWLYASGLDGGLAWAYANDAADVNPYTLTSWNGVAFPAEFTDAAGTVVRREMLPSYVWEAFGAGVTDFRYATTIERLLAERGTDAQRDRFTRLVDGYRQLFTGDEDTRIDVRNSNTTVRETRAGLFALLAELTGS